MSKVVLPQTIGQTIYIEGSNGVTPMACIATLEYTIGDPTSPNNKDPFFVKVSVKLSDNKGQLLKTDSYSLTVNRDLTLSETTDGSKIFSGKKLSCTINGKDCISNADLAVELMHAMSDAYKPVYGSSYIEPVSVLASELIKMSTPSDSGRDIALDDIISVFAYCYDLAGNVFKSRFINYCSQFAEIVAASKATKQTATEPTEEPIEA